MAKAAKKTAGKKAGGDAPAFGSPEWRAKYAKGGAKKSAGKKAAGGKKAKKK
jgi:hypothetical protein